MPASTAFSAGSTPEAAPSVPSRIRQALAMQRFASTSAPTVSCHFSCHSWFYISSSSSRPLPASPPQLTAVGWLLRVVRLGGHSWAPRRCACSRSPAATRNERPARTDRLEIEHRDLALAFARLAPVIQLVVDPIVHKPKQAGEEVQAFPRLVARDVLCGSAACLLSPGAASSVRNRVASTSPFTKYHLGLHRLAVLATPSVIEITPEIAHPEPLELSRDYPGSW